VRGNREQEKEKAQQSEKEREGQGEASCVSHVIASISPKQIDKLDLDFDIVINLKPHPLSQMDKQMEERGERREEKALH